jgi:hypothetical protein
MATLDVVQAVAGSLYLLTVTVVGCRLLFLAYRSRALPELLLGASLVLGGTLGGPMEAAGLSAGLEFGPQLAGRLLLIGMLFGMTGFLCQGLFIWRVFRPGERWAGTLVGVLLVCLLAAMCGFATRGAFTTAEIPIPWFCLALAGRVCTSCWLAFEGFHYYGLMKRRLSLGLADPVVTNRFLLWAVAGVSGVVLLLTAVPPVFLDPLKHKPLLILDLFIFSAAGMISSVLYWLTFFPTAAYRRRLCRAAEGSS